MSFFFFQAEDGIRDIGVTGVQTCALPILTKSVRDLINRGATEADIQKKAEELGMETMRKDATIKVINGETTIEEMLRRSEEHTSELQSRQYLVCRLLLEKKKKTLPLTTSA